MAAWAALRGGCGVDFYSDTLCQSTLHGCQYLHAPIPLPNSYSVADTKVSYRLTGTADQYRQKVYGDSYTGKVSPEDLEGEHRAWDIRATYGHLWSLITNHRAVTIYPTHIDSNWIGAAAKVLHRYSHVISTIPAPALCKSPVFLPSQEGHYFSSHAIKAVGAPSYGFLEPDTITCSGLPEDPWYRSATVFGHTTIEYPRTHRPGLYGKPLVTVRKPLSADCDCHPEIIRLGRYGQWKKGVLVHQVYWSALKLMNGEWV